MFTLLIILWIMLGSAIYPSLYTVIRHLPVFSSFRVAQRFRFDFIIPFALLAGLGLDNVVRLLEAADQSLKMGGLVIPLSGNGNGSHGVSLKELRECALARATGNPCPRELLFSGYKEAAK